MRKITLTLLATTAAFGLAATQATAADLPRKAPPPMVAPPPPLWNWTGFYVGGHLGAGWSRQEFGSPNNGFFTDGEGIGSTDTSVLGSHNGLGPLGGFQVGYNWQFANSPIVLGIEGTFSFADLKGEHSKAFSAASSSGSDNDTSTLRQINFNDTFSSKVKDIATITARLGLASGAQDRTLWYVKGGGAWAKTNYALSANASATSITIDPPDHESQIRSENAIAGLTGERSRWGWTVGTGIEWGLWENWSAKIEYDYLNFGNHDLAFSGATCFSGSFGSGCDPANTTVNVKEQVHMIVIGLNYRFNWGRY